ncbi:cytosine permease [uncultured Microbacterium sp.]|uniref:purine-cytosine permease family protein n=1 Tax=uncultured Microbacterium sp. TaxID=191216 RepID=UPI0028D0429E|nr:cytosine permease [uncultured Microbacterium sp.]
MIEQPASPPVGRDLFQGATDAVEAVGRIETKGIDTVSQSERHGRPWELFPVWFTGNLTYTYLLFGGILIQLGLSLMTALVLAVVVNLAWILVGVMATAGPKTGTATMVVSRAQYGIRGNALSCFFNLVINLGYEGLNIAIATFAASALATFLGFPPNALGKALLVILIGAIVFTLGLYGHATIVSVQKWLSWALGGAAILFIVFLIPHVDWSHQGDATLTSSAMLAAILIGISVVVSGPLSYPIAADYSRYLPRETSSRAVAFFTAVGGYIPTVALTCAGILAATAVDPSDFTTSIQEVVPGWFYPIFLLIIVFGVMSNCIYSIYSSGLAMQSMGIPLKRTRTVWIDGGIGVAIALFGVLAASDFLTVLQNCLLWSVYWLAPFFGIYLTDLAMRRGQYEVVDLFKPGGAYWFNNGFRWQGLAALGLAMFCSAMVSNTPYFQGPLSARLLADGDLSPIVGILVAAVSYWLFTRRTSIPL